jgi:hypothetical protein
MRGIFSPASKNSCLSVSYEFPGKLGLVSVRVNNLTDRRYSFLVDPLALDPRIPKRQVLVLLRFNFQYAYPVSSDAPKK